MFAPLTTFIIFIIFAKDQTYFAVVVLYFRSDAQSQVLWYLQSITQFLEKV
jgi:hypothetical protein